MWNNFNRKLVRKQIKTKIMRKQHTLDLTHYCLTRLLTSDFIHLKPLYKAYVYTHHHQNQPLPLLSYPGIPHDSIMVLIQWLEGLK